MTRQPSDAIGSSDGDEVVDADVRRGMDDVLAALGNAIDDGAILGHIFARLGRRVPEHTARRQAPSATDEVCARIGMLESAITAAVKTGPSASFLGNVSLKTARRYLFELRNGLQSRTITAPDAFRLLGSTRHALREADIVLRHQHDIPLTQTVHAQIGDLRQLSIDLLEQLKSVEEEVTRLFGHSDEAAPILVPQL